MLATQSPALLDHFDPEDVIVASMRSGRNLSFKRLSPTELKEWIDEYTLGQIWEKNVFGGGPYG